jgi:histidyl-tRNA synthetase
MMAADTMEALGIPRGSYVVKVNNRKVLDGVLESIGLSDEANARKRLTVLRALDKLDRLGVEGVRQLLGAGRWDGGEEGKGDFTKGAGLSSEQADRILWITLASIRRVRAAEEFDGSLREDMQDAPSKGNKIDNLALLEDWRHQEGSNAIVCEGIAELHHIASLCQAAGFGTRRVLIDPSVVRGLEYYTGPVYEVELTFPIEGEDGKPVRFGSVAGGGRYDGLVARFRGEPVPAAGFSIGVSRLAAALAHLGKIDTKPEAGPVVVTIFDKDRIADYQKMVAALRNAGIRAELYLGSGKMGPQLKYADRRGSPCVVIQGGDEKAKGEVQIKDLIEGAKAAAAIASNQEWRASRPAQFAVPEAKLVDAVREVLARHDVKWG